MIGFVTSPSTAQAIQDGIAYAQTSRGLPVYWQTGAFEIFNGAYIGNFFIPFDETIRQTILRDGMRAEDFPEFSQLVAVLGGLEARVDLDSSAIIDPSLPTQL